MSSNLTTVYKLERGKSIDFAIPEIKLVNGTATGNITLNSDGTVTIPNLVIPGGGGGGGTVPAYIEPFQINFNTPSFSNVMYETQSVLSSLNDTLGTTITKSTITSNNVLIEDFVLGKTSEISESYIRLSEGSNSLTIFNDGIYLGLYGIDATGVEIVSKLKLNDIKTLDFFNIDPNDQMEVINNKVPVATGNFGETFNMLTINTPDAVTGRSTIEKIPNYNSRVLLILSNAFEAVDSATPEPLKINNNYLLLADNTTALTDSLYNLKLNADNEIVCKELPVNLTGSDLQLSTDPPLPAIQFTSRNRSVRIVISNADNFVIPAGQFFVEYHVMGRCFNDDDEVMYTFNQTNNDAAYPDMIAENLVSLHIRNYQHPTYGETTVFLFKRAYVETAGEATAIAGKIFITFTRYE